MSDCNEWDAGRCVAFTLGGYNLESYGGMGGGGLLGGRPPCDDP